MRTFPFVLCNFEIKNGNRVYNASVRTYSLRSDTDVVVSFAENADRIVPEADFSPKSLPDALRAPIEDCCKVFGVNWDLSAMIGLSCISAAVGKGLEFTTRGNLFCLTIAPSQVAQASHRVSSPLQNHCRILSFN